MYWEPLLIDSV
jgi:hypothetical protein